MKLTIKQKLFYYFLNIVWGFVFALIGFVAAVALLVTGHKPKLYKGVLHFEVDKLFGKKLGSWGGVSLGLVIITMKTDTLSQEEKEALLNHELGHTCQNAAFGPGYIVIALMSFCRYWYFTINCKLDQQFAYLVYHGKKNYNDAWYEKQADLWGLEWADVWS